MEYRGGPSRPFRNTNGFPPSSGTRESYRFMLLLQLYVPLLCHQTYRDAGLIIKTRNKRNINVCEI
jgi:hypothetical protein